MAFGVAKSAERAYQYELGAYPGTTMPQQSFIQFGYWQNNVNGVTAAEQLGLALQQLESAYLTQNEKEHTVNLRISLAATNPLAVEALRRKGSTGTFTLSEELFTRSYPEAYFIRISRLRITVPCVVGPYTPVPLKVSLTKHSIRLNDTLPGGQYESTGDGDDRFLHSVGAVESMFTSTGREDDGLMPGIEDGRPRWFEGAGVANSEFDLSYPSELTQFDSATITDVVFEFQITFREGGPDFKNAAMVHLKDWVGSGYQLFQARADFPNEWHRFLNPPEANSMSVLELPVSLNRFPLAVQDRGVKLADVSVLIGWKAISNATVPTQGVEFHIGSGTAALSTSTPIASTQGVLASINGIQELQGGSYKSTNATLSPGSGAVPIPLQLTVDPSALPGEYRKPVGTAIRINPDAIQDVLILCHYQRM